MIFFQFEVILLKKTFSGLALLRVGGPDHVASCPADRDASDRQPGGLRTEVRLESSGRTFALSRNRFRKSFEGKPGAGTTLK